MSFCPPLVSGNYKHTFDRMNSKSPFRRFWNLLSQESTRMKFLTILCKKRVFYILPEEPQSKKTKTEMLLVSRPKKRGYLGLLVNMTSVLHEHWRKGDSARRSMKKSALYEKVCTLWKSQCMLYENVSSLHNKTWKNKQHLQEDCLRTSQSKDDATSATPAPKLLVVRLRATSVWMLLFCLNHFFKSTGILANCDNYVSHLLISTKSHQGLKKLSKGMLALACCLVDVRECRLTLCAQHTVYFRQRRLSRIADVPTTFNPAA